MEALKPQASQELPAMTEQQRRFSSGSSFGLYRELVSGKTGILYFLYYEMCSTLFAGLGGVIGFALRTLCYPLLFKECGARPAFGRGVLIRRPKQIAIGKRVLVDDYAVLDVRENNASIALGDHVSIGRFSTLAAKGGEISLGNGVNIGSYCRLATQSKLKIGESTLVGAYCYLGPGNHQQGSEDQPLDIIGQACSTRL